MIRVLRGVTGDRKSFESAHHLRTLARESGGRLFTPHAGLELPAIYDAIAEELSNQYVSGTRRVTEPTARFAISQ